MTTVRHATTADATFLQAMLAIAADWRPGSRLRSVEEVMRDPALAHYVSGWPAPGDVGFIAEEAQPVGAAWWRFFSAMDVGFGFVDDQTPEVSIGIRTEFRGRGIGTLLLEALTEEARRRALPALSLSVEAENPAVNLYERVGFVEVVSESGPARFAVDRVGGAITMILQVEA